MERRLVAILAADVVGYGRLREAAEAGELLQFKTVKGGIRLARRCFHCPWSAPQFDSRIGGI
jgi:hypothetical protein